MHLLRTQPGGFVPDDGIAHLAQTPAELVILCSGDSHLALLAEAARALPDDYPSLRLANPMQLQNHASVDLYVDEVLRHARVILLSLHGGIGYWRYGVEQLVALAERGALLIPVPGDDRPDPELSALGNLPAEQAERFWQYLRQGGLENAGQFYRCLASQCLGRDYAWREPQALPRVALFHPRHAEATLEHWRADWQAGRPVVALLFYRTHLQAANTAFIARFCERLAAQGLNPLPIALASLKESACLAQVEDWLERSDAALIVNTTGFAQSNPEAPELRPFRRDVPVLQAICSLDNRPLWLDNPQGLGPRDLAMHVALPELDGRIVTRPISFKGLAWRSERSESDVVCYLADDERMDFVAELARRWAELARKPNAEKRVALVLANYPTRDGRIGNGVGLDTPAAALNILRALRQQGYPVDGLPASGTELIRQLLGGVSNDLEHLDLRPCAQSLALVSMDSYRIGAQEQIKTLGRILNVPVTLVDPGQSLIQALAPLARKRMVLIDTAGLPASDPALRMQLEALASPSLNVKNYLVMATTSQSQVLKSAYQTYRHCGLAGCILTKLDEAGSLGESMALAIAQRLPVAYLADGPRIPDDLQVARSHQLVSRAVSLQAPEEPSEDAMAEMFAGLYQQPARRAG